jgi:DNA invertase Pin-like site-specific DNA recombinase
MTGKATFHMCGVFAEFERAMMRERVCAGLSRSRARGKRLGRPPVLPAIEDPIRTSRETGKGIRAIAWQLGVGVSVVQRIVAQMRQADSMGCSRPACSLNLGETSLLRTCNFSHLLNP